MQKALSSHLFVFLVMAASALTTARTARCAEPAPKFCNIILHNQGADSIVGLHRFVEGAKKRNMFPRLHLTLILNGQEEKIEPGERVFFRELYDAGHEIGTETLGQRDGTAKWLGIPPEKITTTGGQLFDDAAVEQQTTTTQMGYRACLNACVEGNSLGEMWDIPHNWEGAPMFPYWVEWNERAPVQTSRVNREMEKGRATLELHWASRTLWHNYDRFPIPQCWHFGEPLKRQIWAVGQLIHRNEKGGWWRAELTQYENNLAAGRTPFLYLNTASEANIFTHKGPWSGMLDNDEALECALDCVELMLNRGWQLMTVTEFVDWFQQRWPCPTSPSMVYLMDDTLANRRDEAGKTIEGRGRLLHAETKYYQICDHENRAAPEMVVAYDLRTPNLLRNGYTFANPAKWREKEAFPGHYASTTGNALFWGVSDPLKDMDGKPYFPPVKSPDCRNRTFTFHCGDSWEPYQFTKFRFLDVSRNGDEIRWSKTMEGAIPGTDIRVTYHHILNGPLHKVRVEVSGNDAVGQHARLRLCPFYHQGWDPPFPASVSDPAVPDPKTAGQERNVFGRVVGHEFAYSESNKERTAANYAIAPRVAGGPLEISLFNRNPGKAGGTCDDNPAMNRGFTLSVDSPEATVQFIDEPGANRYVTAEIDCGKHASGRAYTFTFRYWHGLPPE